jgi:prepilin-type N-terminal cleavage/methylation domain-containing protein
MLTESKAKRGFTLIEVLCVVTILGIAAAIVIPEVGTRDDLKVAAGARVLMADMIWAQNRAISTEQKQYIVFSGQSYTLWYADSSGVLHTNTNPVTTDTYTTTFAATGTQLEDVSISTTTPPSFASKTALCFDEMGTPWGYNGTSTFSMTTQGQVELNCGTQSLTVYIEPYTGEASVQ